MRQAFKSLKLKLKSLKLSYKVYLIRCFSARNFIVIEKFAFPTYKEKIYESDYLSYNKGVSSY